MFDKQSVSLRLGCERAVLDADAASADMPPLFSKNSLKMTFCMETNTKPLTEEDYYDSLTNWKRLYDDSLKIKSEEDLLYDDLLPVETTRYNFVSESDVRYFESDTDHLQCVAEFALNELKWSENTQRTFRTFISISDILIPNLNEYIEKLRYLHRKVYNSFYGKYTREISELYNNKLRQPLSRLREVAVRIKDQLLWPMMKDEAKHEALQRIIGHELECGWRRVTIEELRQRKDRTAHENEADQRDIPDHRIIVELPDEWLDDMPGDSAKTREIKEELRQHIVRTAHENEADLRDIPDRRIIVEFPDEWLDDMPDDSTKISVLETIMSVLTQIAEAVGKIYYINNAICNAWNIRKKSETFIIYSCMKKQYEEEWQKGMLADFSERQSRYRKDRQLPLDSQYLVRLLDETEQEFNQNALCSMWHECGSDIEYFAFMLSDAKYNETDFDLLFEYQAKCEMIKGMIADARSSEQGRDPLFADKVDPFKLEKHLHFWIEARVTTQEKWYVVWCLMIYTFEIIRREAKMNDFAERMSLMFPDAPKKCVVESFRKQANKKIHKCHFSKWLKTDPDYAMAKNLYEKLNNKEWYEREETDL